MLDWLLEPLQFSFILRALIASAIVGVVCSVLGTYIVLRGMAFFGDALAHTILPGVVIAFLLGCRFCGVFCPGSSYALRYRRLHG
jgi:manganese/iron transport system permease protein